MTGAMYAAIAGLKTHMQNLNVISNNVANVNTYGYKASRAVFKTSLYTTLSGGSNGTATMGGTNPSQIGYGSTVSTVDVDMSTGNYAVTGKSTDLMLDGDGFFLVGSKEIAKNFTGTMEDEQRLSSLTLTRVGNFEFRADGYLAKEDGNCVYGFLCVGYWGDANHPKAAMPSNKKEGDPIFSDQLVPIRLPRVTDVYRTETGEIVDVRVTTGANDPVGEPNANGDYVYADDAAMSTALKALTANGTLIPGRNIAYPETSRLVVDANGAPVPGADGNPQYINIPLQDAGYDPQLEDSPLAQGQFTGIAFDPNTGIITGISRDTEQVVTIGCIAVGSVTNPNGVTNLGDNYYKASEGSGNLTISILGNNGPKMGIYQINSELNPNDDEIVGLTVYSSASHIISNGLEMSKTDLAQEIANMILTQRGYQANTRIVTVTDSMLEELVNMKR